MDAMVAPGARILDAGCGTGRVGGELAARGHRIVGVDADPALIEAACADHPGSRWLVGDLAELDLAAHDEPEPFDAVVCAGNVMAFVAVGTERAVVSRIAAHIRPDGVAVIGFRTDRGYPLTEFDADAVAAGLRREHRFATWDLRPWRDDADFAVTLLRKPGV